MIQPRLTAALLALTSSLLMGLPPTGASAQDAEVSRRLVEFGRMSPSDARDLSRAISSVLQANAERGGESYDSLRQKVNSAIFGTAGGPGQNRAEYDQRMAMVLERMRGGLDAAMLPVLFPNTRNSAVMCSNTFGVTMGECDALVAAASQMPSALPFIPPDDGSALRAALRSNRAGRRDATEVATRLREVMLGVPRILTNDARGRALIGLLEACPGGTPDRESQIRAWHVGPNEGMARCIATNMARGGPAQAQALFGLSPQAAQAFMTWGAPAAAPAAAPEPVYAAAPPMQAAPPPRPPPRRTVAPPAPTAGPSPAETLRTQARSHFRSRRFQQAAAAYEAAASIEPGHAGTQAGLGACRLAMGDARGAAAAYQQAVRLDERNVGYFTALGRAYATGGHREGAISALQQALRIDPNHQPAQQGLQALGGTPPPPPPPPAPVLPETPPRQAIISTMRPLAGALRGCAPTYDGTVTFALTVVGDTGEVTGAVINAGDLSGTEEGACMESVVRSAAFPRFTQGELNINYPFRIQP